MLKPVLSATARLFKPNTIQHTSKMAENPVITAFLEGNAKYAATYTPFPPLSKVREMVKQSPSKGVCVCQFQLPTSHSNQSNQTPTVTCSDPRTAPELFMPREGMRPAVIRNAGGRAMDAMRSLHVLNAIAPIGTVVVVHHTGMSPLSHLHLLINEYPYRLRNNPRLRQRSPHQH